MKTRLLIIATFLFTINTSFAQFDEDQLGAWYMYFFSGSMKKDSKWGFQGDIQHRNWDSGSDLEQLLLRGGVTYKPEHSPMKFTFGYGNISSGTFGDSKTTTSESRIYQEAIYPLQLCKRFYSTHRFRYEQRFVDNQDFRTRYRYNFFLNIALNKKEMEAKTIYVALYNELFINGQREIGNDRTVEIFDRNRFYSAIGYVFKDGLKAQLGVMTQTTDNWSKRQIQLSLHQKL